MKKSKRILTSTVILPPREAAVVIKQGWEGYYAGSFRDAKELARDTRDPADHFTDDLSEAAVFLTTSEGVKFLRVLQKKLRKGDPPLYLVANPGTAVAHAIAHATRTGVYEGSDE